MRIFHSCWLLAGKLVNRKYFSSLVKSSVTELGTTLLPELSKSIKCCSDEDIIRAGYNLGTSLEPGDVVLISGDLGAGKTCLSRGIVRSKFNDLGMVVTSPSYLLDNCYRYGEEKYIHHIDLYRLPTGSDLSILNIPDIYESSICLIEWPQRIQGAHQFPSSYLDVKLTVNKDDSRGIKLTAMGVRWTTQEHKARISEALSLWEGEEM